MSPEEECQLRNTYIMMEGEVPSYALWRINDIENKTIEERIRWWVEINPRNEKEEEYISETIRNLRHYRHCFMTSEHSEVSQ